MVKLSFSFLQEERFVRPGRRLDGVELFGMLEILITLQGAFRSLSFLRIIIKLS